MECLPGPSEFPRSRDRGPIEAMKCRGSTAAARKHFRDHVIAAPLKHHTHRTVRLILAPFPRSRDPGPIEAISPLAGPPGELVLPRSRDRGPIEARTGESISF